MRRLRHPIRAIREPFGTAGLIVACVALIAAVGGTAYAAAKLNSTQKKEVEKIAKKFAGKPGTPGATGATGATGAKGDKGDPGIAGTSVTNTPLAKGNVNCPEGGAEFKVGAGTPTRACNGTTGFTDTLPSNKTETGNWSTIGLFAPVNGGVPFSAISYPIPLAAPSEKAVFLNQAETEASAVTPVQGCSLQLQSLAAKPVAPAGTLCVFTRHEEFGSFKFIGEDGAHKGDSLTGAFLWLEPLEITPESAAIEFWGTWAVTAK